MVGVKHRKSKTGSVCALKIRLARMWWTWEEGWVERL